MKHLRMPTTAGGHRSSSRSSRSKYQPWMCDRVIELGRAGRSRVAIANALGVDRGTLSAWAATHPEFLFALTMAKQLEMDWWEHMAMKCLIELPGGARLNTAAWLRSMAARFPREYRRASEVNLDQPGMVAEQLIREIVALRTDDARHTAERVAEREESPRG